MSGYFVVRYDGVRGPFTEQELLEKISPDADGYTQYGSDLRFHSKVPDCGEFGVRDIVILRGSVILPKPKTVVQTFELPGDRDR